MRINPSNPVATHMKYTAFCFHRATDLGANLLHDEAVNVSSSLFGGQLMMHVLCESVL